MFQNIVKEIQLAWRLLRDSRVPVWMKAIPVLSVLYVLMPIDLIPDILLGFGQLDDLALLIGGVRLFTSLAPHDVVEEHLAEIEGRQVRGQVITPKSSDQRRD